MYEVQLCFNGKWITVGEGYRSRDDAWWAVSLWRQENDCRKDDCFRVRLQEQDESDGIDLSKRDLSA